MDFERGLTPTETSEFGWKKIAKEWLREKNIDYKDIQTENSGSENFAVVVYIDWHVLNIPFDNNDEIRIPEKVIFRRIIELP